MTSDVKLRRKYAHMIATAHPMEPADLCKKCV